MGLAGNQKPIQQSRLKKNCAHISAGSLIRVKYAVQNLYPEALLIVLLDFLVTVQAAPHECVIRTGLP